MGNTSFRRQNVWINDKALRDVDPRVLIRAITEPDNEVESEFGSFAGRYGRIPLLRPVRRSKKVEVEFAIRELYDLPARARVLDAVNGWAQDGVMMISSRPDQRLRVYCAQRASGGNLRDYTATYKISFETGGVPFWEDLTPVSALLDQNAATQELYIPGTAETVADVSITLGAAATFLRVVVRGGDLMTRTINLFNDDGFAAGTTIELTHDEHGILTGPLEYRNGASDDDLYVSPGLAEVSIMGSGNFTATVSARGRWL